MCHQPKPDSHARQPCLFPVTPACTWQRICEDVRNYVNASVMLTISVMRKLLNCLAFTGVLCVTEGQPAHETCQSACASAMPGEPH